MTGRRVEHIDATERELLRQIVAARSVAQIEQLEEQLATYRVDRINPSCRPGPIAAAPVVVKKSLPAVCAVCQGQPLEAVSLLNDRREMLPRCPHCGFHRGVPYFPLPAYQDLRRTP